jgi:hypothetical protein
VPPKRTVAIVAPRSAWDPPPRMVAPPAPPLRLTTYSPPLLRVRIPYPILTTPSSSPLPLRSNLPASLVEELNSWRQALARRPDPARRKPAYRGGESRGREARAAVTQRVRPWELAKVPEPHLGR